MNRVLAKWIDRFESQAVILRIGFGSEPDLLLAGIIKIVQRTYAYSRLKALSKNVPLASAYRLTWLPVEHFDARWSL